MLPTQRHGGAQAPQRQHHRPPLPATFPSTVPLRSRAPHRPARQPPRSSSSARPAPRHPGNPPPGPPAAHPGACMRPMMAAVEKKGRREGEAFLPPERT